MLYSKRSARPGNQRFPGLTGIRPIIRQKYPMHCASTASDIFSLWHCSLLTHIIAYLHQCRKLPSLPPLFFFFQIPPADGLSVRLFDAQSAAFHRIIHLAPRLLHMPDSLLGGVSVPVCSAARHQCDLRCQRLQKPGGIGIARSVMRRLIKSISARQLPFLSSAARSESPLPAPLQYLR